MTTLFQSAIAAAATLALAAAGCSTTPTRVEEARLGAPAVAAASPMPTTATEGRDGVLLLGQSALYYMYRTNRKGVEVAREPGQYRLDKYGRVYFRDESFDTHWVTPPQEGFRVSSAEAADYEGILGYRGIPEGRDLKGLANE